MFPSGALLRVTFDHQQSIHTVLVAALARVAHALLNLESRWLGAQPVAVRVTGSVGESQHANRCKIDIQRKC